MDCPDESDENECEVCRIPDKKYKKEYKPRPLDGQDSLAIRVSLKVNSVDSVRELESVYQVRFALGVMWYDKRLDFYNLHQRKVSYREGQVHVRRSTLFRPDSSTRVYFKIHCIMSTLGV